jgi:hypothetical protein
VLLPRLNEAQAEMDAIQHRLSATRAEAADLGGDSEKIFENITRSLDAEDSIDARAQLREDLGRIIDTCDVDANAGLVHIHVRGAEVPITVPLRPDVALPGIEMQQMTEDAHAELVAED